MSLKHPLQRLKTTLNYSCDGWNEASASWWWRNSEGVLPPAHLSKQLIKPKITHQHITWLRCRAWAEAREQSNSKVRAGNKQPPPHTQWGDGGSHCSDCTAEQEEETSHQAQAQQQSEKRGGGGSFLCRRGGAEVRGRRQQDRTNKGEVGCGRTFFLFLRVAVALVFDEAGAGRASSAGHALQTPLHQLTQLDSWYR